MANQFENLQAGDKVFLVLNRSFDTQIIDYYIVPIKRITKTLVVLPYGKKDKELRFNKRNGRTFGDQTWSRTWQHIEYPITSEHHKKVKQSKIERARRKKIKHLTEYDWNNLDDSQLGEILHLLSNANQN